MAILAFQKPDKVIMLDATETFGRFEFRPLEPGYGITIGNALRRILLSSLEGFAITSIRIDGVAHEFDTIPGVIESVVDIILNLKQVRFKRMIEDADSETATITVSGKTEFTAEDISKNLSSFKVLNPELHICSMEPTVKFVMDLRIGKGRGYVPSDENKVELAPVDTIAIDSIFTPIKNVKYTVEPDLSLHALLRREDHAGDPGGSRQQGTRRGSAPHAPSAADQALRHGTFRPGAQLPQGG